MKGRLDKAQTFLMHMYRAEVGKLATYRTRLDATTKWALTVLALFLTLLWNDESPRPEIMPILICILYAFCWIEARRFRSFLHTNYVVTLLKSGFYAEIIGLGGVRRGWLRELNDIITLPRDCKRAKELRTTTPSASFLNRFHKSY